MKISKKEAIKIISDIGYSRYAYLAYDVRTNVHYLSVNAETENEATVKMIYQDTGELELWKRKQGSILYAKVASLKKNQNGRWYLKY